MNKNKKASLTKSQLNLTKALESLFGGRDVFPQKFPDGGPIIPDTSMSQETTRNTILPRAGSYSYKSDGMIVDNLAIMGEMINDALPNKMKIVSNDMMGLRPSVSSPSNSGKLIGGKFREKAYGGTTQEEQQEIEQRVGQINQTGDAIAGVASAIPVFGPIIGGAVKLGSMALGIGKREQLEFENRTQPVKTPENIYGNFAKGGLITNGFKQYNTGSHSSGNDQGIDINGNPNSNATGGYIQNKENSYNFGGQTYVMSDTLVNPETGNLFNQDASKLNKKYKNADSISEEKNALDFGMGRLSKLNDGMRNLKEQVLKACGGPTKKTMDGGGNPSRNRPWIDAAGIIHYPDNQLVDESIQPVVTGDMVPSGNNPLEGLGNLNNYFAQPIPDTSNPVNAQEFTPGQNLTPFTFTPAIDRGGDDLMGNVSNKPLTKKVKSAFNGNTAAIALKGLGLIKSISDAAADPEKESVITPDYSKADKQIYSANIDYTQARQDALAATNLASNVNRSSSSGFQSFQGRQAMNFANLADQLGNIGMQENNQRSQLALQRGQYETTKAVDTANRKYQNRIDNQMNKANADLADQKLFSELTQIGTTFNDYQYYKDALKNNKEIAHAKIKEAAAILGTKYENFGFDQEFIDKVSKGDYEGLDFDQAIKFIATADQVKKAKKG